MEYNSIQDFKSNFAQVYHKSVVPMLAPYETERINIKRKAKLLMLVVFILFVILGLSYLGILGERFQRPPVYILFMVPIMFSVFCYSMMTKNFENKLKSAIMPNLMKAFGNFVWTTGCLIDKQTVKDTKIFSRFDHKDNDDNFYGTYKGLTININETELYYYRKDSKDRLKKEIEFKGVLVEIDVKKPFKGHTVIRNRNYLFNNRAYEEVKLEDPEFSKSYYVDSNDQVEARYLLTTSFMERFKNIKNAFGGNSMEASFKNSKLILAISTQKDLFKLGRIGTPVNDTKQFTQLLNEFVSILAIVDELKLNQNIGL